MEYEKLIQELEGYKFDKLIQHGDGIGLVYVLPYNGDSKTVVMPNLAEVYIEE